MNIAEKAAGFTISGDTGSVGGVTVTVRVGTGALTATSADTNPATWSVTVPGDAAYISEPSVAVEVNASKTGFAAARAVQSTLAVDLTAPTAPTYTAPGSLQVGVAIAAVSPSGGSGIDEYGATGLPSGLSIDTVTGVISGTPDSANASTASVTVTVSDTAGNADTVTVTFPAVSAAGTLEGASISAGNLLIQLDSTGVVTGLRESDARGTDHNIAAQSTTLVSLVVESAATDLPSSGTGAHYKPTGWTYAAGTAGTGETTRGDVYLQLCRQHQRRCDGGGEGGLCHTGN